MNKKELSKQLLNSVLKANDAINSEDMYSNEELNDFVSEMLTNVVNVRNEYGLEITEKALLEIGFNNYETKVIIENTNQDEIVNTIKTFFEHINLQKDYVSPLNENKDWLSKKQIDASKLSDEYGSLVKYVNDKFSRQQKAEFLAIIDRYVAVKSSDPKNEEVLNKLKNFDPNNETDKNLLISEINKFAQRYTLGKNGKVTKSHEPFLIRAKATNKKNDVLKGDLWFNVATTGQPDCVFEDSDGSIGLICATSNDDTKKQQQVYFYRRDIANHFKKEVNSYLYVDAFITANEKINKIGASKFSSANEVKNLPKEEINSINLVNGLMCLARPDSGSEDYFKTLDTLNIQIINDDAGLELLKLSGQDKIDVFSKSILNATEVILNNKDFWISSGSSRTKQDKLVVKLAGAYTWLAFSKNLTDHKLSENIKEIISLRGDFKDVKIDGDEATSIMSAKMISESKIMEHSLRQSNKI